ncbi:MAG: hypothetical protein Q7T11_02815 [Deltaproteobacteria bacterium]|nr:hypothetical protein [Deltaproteobacteria bacterium]
MRWLWIAFILAGCVSRGPQFSIERNEDTPLNAPEGSIGEIPPVLETVSVMGNSQARMSSTHFSLFGTASSFSQTVSHGNQTTMTGSTLAIGAQEVEP